ncbi:MAG: Asp-tRNA(Asn)/Glu-tRNA(Gln) amidotransferase subunit GatB [Nitrospinae bacterium]|nr:Asp-tRNA(Asn)/Glu-tRNA(Gln) amidotransferase subunit GatB [Nitrospinota bacterium]
MEFEAVIGLEVHVQINTKSKIFCGCPTKFGEEPNRNTCPICLGMPGVLPVLNREAVNLGLKTALATGCKINPLSRFSRKNYFYPDLPKGYQISQYELPLAERGRVCIKTGGKEKAIGITRIHLEEDAGKSIHGENLGDPASSYVDFNRTGVPLMEIVSEPEMHSPEEAREYLQNLKSILEYIEVSDCNMEEGSLRCDANISLRPVGQKELGTKTELKNMNSFRNVQRALEHEVERQTHLLQNGKAIIQGSRLWDAAKNETVSMREKEEAHDYRYFPEPDLPPVAVDQDWINGIEKTLPELPAAKRERFVSQYGIPEYDAGVLTASRSVADYYERCVSLAGNPKIVSNWVMGDVLRVLKEKNMTVEQFSVTPERLASMIGMISSGTISGAIAKTVFEEMSATGKDPKAIVEEKGLAQISDEKAIEEMVDAVLASHPVELETYKKGKETLFGFFVGQAMKAAKGKANPSLINKILKEKLSRLKGCDQ